MIFFMSKNNKGAAAVKGIKRVGGFIIDVIKYSFGFIGRKIKEFVDKRLKDRSIGQAVRDTFSAFVQKLRSVDIKSIKPGEKIKSLHPAAAAGTCLGAVLLIFLIAFSIHNSSHFMSGTSINGVDVSGMNIKQARNAITDAASSYKLSIFEKDGVTETITAQDIEMTVDISDDFNHVLTHRSGYSWIGALFGNKTINTDGLITYEYNDDLFNKKISSLKCLNPEVVTEPVDAELYFHDGAFDIRPSITGSKADPDRLEDRIKKAIADQETSVNLEMDGIYAMPKVLTGDSKLNAKKDAYAVLADMTITLRFGKHDHVLDPLAISSWYTLENDESLKLNDAAIKSTADELSALYNTIHKPKDFVTHYGEVVTLANSYYGWELDVDYVTDMLKSYAEKKESVFIDLTNGSEESNKWWMKTAVAYDDSDYYGNTYAEVSIDGQYMWMYQNGEVVLESDVVTGMPDSEHDTPIGIYSIIYMQENATLRGDDYETEVAYWMVFTTDIGFHDADWQWAFGDDMYIDNGSHGCVNLPLEVAEQLYGFVYPGMPVFVY